MSDQINEKTIRAAFTDLALAPENREYGDEGRVEFALLNGKAPRESSSAVNIPQARATLRVNFPAGTDFVRMAAVMEALEQAVRFQCSQLAAGVGVGVGE